MTESRSSFAWLLRVMSGVIALVSLLLWGANVALLVGCVAVVVGELILAFGIASVVCGLALIAFPPGLIARNGSPFLFAALVLAVVPFFVKPDAIAPKRVVFISLAPILAALSVFVSGSSRPELLLTVAGLCVPVYLFSTRRQLAQNILACVSWVVVLEAVSFLLSLVQGRFSGAPARMIVFPNGSTWDVYFPFTPTVGGTRVLGSTHGIPRIVMFTSEPGLSVFVLAIAVSYFFTRKGVLNRAALVMVVIAAIATQSFGTYLSLLAGSLAVVVLFFWTKRQRVVAVGILAVGSLATLALGRSAIEVRVARSSNTVHDRGLGGGDTLAVGNVNLLVGLSHYKFETAVLLVAILLASVFVISNFSTPAIFLLAATLCTAAFNEPLVWQFGIWILLTLQTVAHKPVRPSLATLARQLNTVRGARGAV